MNLRTLSEIVSIFEAAYNTTLSEEQQAIWFQLLEPLNDTAVKNACIQTARTSVYPPKPADIWNLCKHEGARAIPSAEETRKQLESLQNLEGKKPIALLVQELADKKAMP